MATDVQVCAYAVGGRSRSDALLAGSLTLRIEEETNALRRATPQEQALNPTGPCGPGPDYVTFASATKVVSVTVDGCGAVTSGGFLAFATTLWLNDLQRLTTAPSVVVPSVVGKNCRDAVGDLSELAFVIISTGARCGVGVIVLAQNPKAGSLARRRGTVTIDLAFDAGPQCGNTTGRGASRRPTGCSG